ncbi:MAG: ankyrin repeat domain-containing protein [Campylobacteraceae bacterium]|jgi:ankyrin repeat protein|nr:ankyrin repeat domain-containing protein [Campylobacteraceae bacterium]
MYLDNADIKRYEELLCIAVDFARYGQTIELESMLKAKLPINLKDHKGNTLLMLAAYNGNTDIVKMLISMGADVNLKNDRGQTPLAGVCFKGYLDIVKLLIENGANIDEDNGFGMRAVMFASMFGNYDIVKYLSSHKKTFRFKFYLLLSKLTALFKRKKDNTKLYM